MLTAERIEPAPPRGEWSNFEGPAIHPFDIILRCGDDPDAYVVIGDRDGDGLERLAMYPADSVDGGLFDPARPHLERGGVVSLNPFMVPGKQDSEGRRMAYESHAIPGLPAPDTRYPRRLSAVAVDLDFRKEKSEDGVPKTFGDALGSVVDMVDRGDIPNVSAYWRSSPGGLWCIWLLRDDTDPERPPPAFPKLQQFYKAIGKNVARRFEGLGVDIGASGDVRGYLRVPGSVHPGTGERTQGFFAAGPDGQPITYTLKELANALGMTPPSERQSHIPREKDRTAVAKGFKGNAGRARRLRNQLDALARWRGGFGEGMRGDAFNLYATCLLLMRRGARTLNDDDTENPLFQFRGMTDGKLGDILREFGERWCAPPIERQRIDDQTRYQLKRRKFGLGTNVDIAELLVVTPEEHAELRDAFLEKRGQEVLPVAARFAGLPIPERKEALPLGRDELEQIRRRQLQSLIDEAKLRGDKRPSDRQLSKMLKERGFNGSPTTVGKDLVALGFKSKPSPKKTPPALPFHDSPPTP